MKTGKNIWRNLFGIIVIICMLIIFIGSNATGLQSDQIVSMIWNDIVKYNMKIFVPDNIGKFHISVRDWVHVYLFAILGFFISLWSIYELRLKTSKEKFGIAIILSFLYSIIDEIHQLFVYGRNFEFKDLLHDFIGYSFSIIMVMFFIIN